MQNRRLIIVVLVAVNPASEEEGKHLGLLHPQLITTMTDFP